MKNPHKKIKTINYHYPIMKIMNIIMDSYKCKQKQKNNENNFKKIHLFELLYQFIQSFKIFFHN